MKPQTPEEKEYNRQAMAKVRSDVRAFVEKGETKGMSHLGEYPRTMEEAVRTIIALQDLLDKSMDKHALATEHLLEEKKKQETVSSVASYMINHATESVLSASDTLGQLQKELSDATDQIDRLQEDYNKSNDLVCELTADLCDREEELEAALATLKVVMK